MRGGCDMQPEDCGLPAAQAAALACSWIKHPKFSTAYFHTLRTSVNDTAAARDPHPSPITVPVVFDRRGSAYVRPAPSTPPVCCCTLTHPTTVLPFHPSSLPEIGSLRAVGCVTGLAASRGWCAADQLPSPTCRFNPGRRPSRNAGAQKYRTTPSSPQASSGRVQARHLTARRCGPWPAACTAAAS